MTDHAYPPDERKEHLQLSRAVEFLLDECRMVLPGIQALFGFQLIAVFSPGFSEALGTEERWLHLAAISLIALSIALIMAPAAYHRHTPTMVTETFIRLSTHFLVWSMAPLCLGICLDYYLVARIILDSTLAALPAAVLLGLFGVLWFVLPRLRALRRAASRLDHKSR